MDYSLSTEQEILRDSVRSFAENEIKPVAQELDEKEEFSYETMKKMAELGLFGVFVSEQYGGQAMDYLSYIIAVEEIARVDGSHAATVAAENSLGIGPLYYFGNEEQKRQWLPRIFSGEEVWCQLFSTRYSRCRDPPIGGAAGGGAGGTEALPEQLPRQGPPRPYCAPTRTQHFQWGSTFLPSG